LGKSQLEAGGVGVLLANWGCGGEPEEPESERKRESGGQTIPRSPPSSGKTSERKIPWKRDVKRGPEGEKKSVAKEILGKSPQQGREEKKRRVCEHTHSKQAGKVQKAEEGN